MDKLHRRDPGLARRWRESERRPGPQLGRDAQVTKVLALPLSGAETRWVLYAYEGNQPGSGIADAARYAERSDLRTLAIDGRNDSWLTSEEGRATVAEAAHICPIAEGDGSSTRRTARTRRDDPRTMPMTEPAVVRSRVGEQTVYDDGTTRCVLKIPLGHPAARRRDDEGHVFEIEHEVEYAAGPGNQELRWINPATGEEEPVGEDLLPTSEDDAVRISASNLSAYLRKGARLFDASVRSDVGP